MTALLAAMILAVIALRSAALARRRVEAGRLAGALGRLDRPEEPSGTRRDESDSSLASARAAAHRFVTPAVIGSALCGAACGAFLAGLPGGIGGGAMGALIPRAVSHRRAASVAGALDRQVGEFADGVASAVRGGLSISQAVEFAAAEADPPLGGPAGALLRNRRMGIPLTEALERFADSVATDEARLLALVLGVHHRSGGNVAAALEDITATIRHRLDLRRELRAITAQGRISGYILGVLPLAFFVVLSVTSRRELSPVLHSPAGAVLVSAGLGLEGLAYLWIRRLLRVDV
jgi:tight adherence protein B